LNFYDQRGGHISTTFALNSGRAAARKIPHFSRGVLTLGKKSKKKSKNRVTAVFLLSKNKKIQVWISSNLKKGRENRIKLEIKGAMRYE
jgi:hypothetical protein